MREEDFSRLEAWFDGEVSTDEKLSVEQLLSNDPEARDYLKELERTRELLMAAHPEKPAPFSWEQLSGQERVAGRDRPRRVLSFPRMITALAAVLVLGVALWFPIHHSLRTMPVPASMNSSVELVETDLEGATPVVYLDQPSGWTVVWVVEEGEQTEI